MSIDANFTQFHADIHGLRQSKKIHYAFYDVPFLTACALIRGAEGRKEIYDFGETICLGSNVRIEIPVHDTITMIISRIKPAQFQATFVRWTNTINE